MRPIRLTRATTPRALAIAALAILASGHAQAAEPPAPRKDTTAAPGKPIPPPPWTTVLNLTAHGINSPSLDKTDFGFGIVNTGPIEGHNLHVTWTIAVHTRDAADKYQFTYNGTVIVPKAPGKTSTYRTVSCVLPAPPPNKAQPYYCKYFKVHLVPGYYKLLGPAAGDLTMQNWPTLP